MNYKFRGIYLSNFVEEVGPDGLFYLGIAPQYELTGKGVKVLRAAGFFRWDRLKISKGYNRLKFVAFWKGPQFRLDKKTAWIYRGTKEEVEKLTSEIQKHGSN